LWHFDQKSGRPAAQQDGLHACRRDQLSAIMGLRSTPMPPHFPPAASQERTVRLPAISARRLMLPLQQQLVRHRADKAAQGTPAGQPLALRRHRCVVAGK